MRSSIRRLAVLVGGPAALLLATAGYALAGAGSAPAIVLDSYGGYHHAPQMYPEAGDLLIASGGINVVNANGPVAGIGGTDHEHSLFSDTWTFANGSVNVLHAPPPPPVLDLATCSAIIVQRDAWWKFAGGTGADWGAQGSGKFTELALFSFAVDKRGHCDFDAYGQMHGLPGSPYMMDHGRVLRPAFFSVEVQFVGKASLPQHHAPKPVPTPTYTTPAPVTTATVPAPTPTYSTTAPPVD